jgi:serine/threonine-protein kinase
VDADRNLCLGVLALRAQLLDAERFAEICTVWHQRRSTPLGDLLQERGWISAADRHRLERQVGGAGCATDLLPPPLAARARTLPLPLDTAPPEPDRAGRQCGPYALVRQHAAGGIGRVWLARDERLRREVALKELLPEQGPSAAARQRFLLEARITGQLEHPGVVPVYELGDGPAPYYTMRFVHGRTLDQAAQAYHAKRAKGRARPLDLHKLLRAFVSVCQTVAYAHARGVVHRDLKGANVLLGDYGEAIVLDWGMAKVRGAEAATDLPPVADDGPGGTVAGQVLGTPAYMPPEQAAGRQDLVDHRSDVYALGAMLYEILTGRPPFTGDQPQEVLRRVREAAPPPPRRVCPGVPAALEAICLKALARAPADRYAAAKDLAGDVEHWLADEPTQAYREPWAARLGRWTRRHRTPVAALGALLLAAVAALTVTTTLVGRAQARTQQAYETAEALRQRAEAAAAEAQRQKEAAEANYRLARETVDRFFVQVSEDTLLRQPGLEPLRKRLLQTALAFYQDLLDRHDADPALRRDLGRTHLQLAAVLRQIESPAAALKHLEEAQAIFRELLAREPDDAALRHHLLVVAQHQGTLFRMVGRLDRAAEALQEAAARQEQLVRERPGERDFQDALAATHVNLGNVYKVIGPAERAEAAYQRAVGLYEELLKDAKAPADRVRRAGGAHAALGQWHLARNDADGAERQVRQGLGLYEKLAQKFPNDGVSQGDLARAQRLLGEVQVRRRRPAEAEAAFTAAVARLEQVGRTNPSLTEYRGELGLTLGHLGALLKGQNRAAEAETAWRKGLEVLTPLTKAHPEIREWAWNQASTAAQLAARLLEADRAADALPFADQAVRTLEGLYRGPLPAENPQLLATAYLVRAKTLNQLGRWAEAADAWDRVVESMQGTSRLQARLERAAVWARLGEHARAVREEADVGAEPAATPDLWLFRARVRAQAAAAVGRDPRVAEADRARRAEEHLEAALDCLRQARAEGVLKTAAQKRAIAALPDLAPLRPREAFQEVLK